MVANINIIVPYTIRCIGQGMKGQYPKTEPWYVDQDKWDGDSDTDIRQVDECDE